MSCFLVTSMHLERKHLPYSLNLQDAVLPAQVQMFVARSVGHEDDTMRVFSVGACERLDLASFVPAKVLLEKTRQWHGLDYSEAVECLTLSGGATPLIDQIGRRSMLWTTLCT